MKTAKILLTLALFTGLPGCGALVMTYHNAADWSGRHWSAEKAWHVRRWMYADVPCRGSFKAGFKAGYRFACGGHDSCEPPQYRHYWRYGGLTNSERENAQAWSDGFTHGTVAAQQDHTAAPSALDMQTMQPPPGVPDVRYNVPPQVPNDFGADGGIQYGSPTQMGTQMAPMQGQPTPGYEYPGGYGQNFQPGPAPYGTSYAPDPSGYQQYVPPGPMPAPASEAMPGPQPLMQPGLMPGAQPGLAPVPAPAPASVSAVDARYLRGPVMASEGSPGMGNSPMPGGLQPAPPAESAPEYMAQRQFASPAQTTQAVDWELPLIRN